MTIEDEQAAAAVLAGVVALDDDVQPPDHVQAAFAAMQAESRQALRDGRPQPTLPSVTRLPDPVMVEVIPGVVIRPGDRLIVNVNESLTVDAATALERRLIDQLPGLAGVVFLPGPNAVAGVYRTEES